MTYTPLFKHDFQLLNLGIRYDGHRVLSVASLGVIHQEILHIS